MNRPEDQVEDENSSAGMLVEGGAGISAVVRAEIDMQITTARAYPRRPTKVRDQLVELVTLDDAAAQEAMYALPRAGKPVTGPSIRFAESVKQAWGNCRAASRVSEVNRAEKYVEAEGVFHDLETNTITRVTHRRRISNQSGRVFSDDMILVTANAACSVAMRESILKGVPKPVWRAAYDAVLKVIAGDIMTIAENRDKAIKSFAVFGVKPEQVYTALGVEGEADITLDHITVMRGMFSAIKNGEATVEEIFAKPTKQIDPNYNPLVKERPIPEKVDPTTGEVTGSATADEGSFNEGGLNEVANQTPLESKTAPGPMTGKAGENPATDPQTEAQRGTAAKTTSSASQGEEPTASERRSSVDDRGAPPAASDDARAPQQQLAEDGVPNADASAKKEADAAPNASTSQPTSNGAGKGEAGPGDSLASAGAPPNLRLGFSRALSRATQSSSLKKIKDQFWGQNEFPLDDEEEKAVLNRIWRLHVDRISGTADLKEIHADLAELGAA
jgi:hypothetical protein